MRIIGSPTGSGAICSCTVCGTGSVIGSAIGGAGVGAGGGGGASLAVCDGVGCGTGSGIGSGSGSGSGTGLGFGVGALIIGALITGSGVGGSFSIVTSSTDIDSGGGSSLRSGMTKRGDIMKKSAR